jgi:Protein of unknown function DUF262/Protein of unknown function (DUF1524)
MKRQLESRALAVEEVFASPFLFVSPPFQRPFAWDVDDADRLLGDLLAAFATTPDEIYFLGAILLVRIPLTGEQPKRLPAETIFSGDDRVFEIIDGQQRIATLGILLAVLRDLTNQSGRDAAAAQALFERTRRAYSGARVKQSRVQLRGQDGEFFTHCTSETGACLVPPLSVADSDPQERLLTIRDFFVNRLQALDKAELERFASFVLENSTLVTVVTNTIDRAFQMFTVLNDTGKPLTRNDILKAELIGAVPTADRVRATEVWDDLAQRLGTEFEQLFSYVSTEAGRGSLQIVDAIRLQAAEARGGASGFIFDTLAPSGAIVDEIFRCKHTGASQSAAINQLLRYLGWLTGREWVPPLLAYWKRHGSNPEALLTFLRALDRCTYGSRLLTLGNDRRAQRMAALTTLILAGAPPLGPWGPLQFNRDEVRNINFGLRDLHKRSPQICKLVLLRLDEQMSGRSPVAYNKPMTAEHILPTKTAVNSQWRIDIPDQDERTRLATCLGNLTLVTGPVNERAGNHDYARKRTIYFAADATPLSNLTAELRNVPAWTTQQIEDRLARMLRTLNEMWQLNA